MAALAGPNGLHPRGCACAVCEVGCTPTDAARALADRAALSASYARNRAAKRLERERDRATLAAAAVARTAAQCEAWRKVRLPSDAELDELRELRRGMFSPGRLRR